MCFLGTERLQDRAGQKPRSITPYQWNAETEASLLFPKIIYLKFVCLNQCCAVCV